MVCTLEERHSRGCAVHRWIFGKGSLCVCWRVVVSGKGSLCVSRCYKLESIKKMKKKGGKRRERERGEEKTRKRTQTQYVCVTYDEVLHICTYADVNFTR